MGGPTIYQSIRQTLGRALRETGQALDRAGIKGHKMVVQTRVIGDDPVIYQDHLSRHRQQMPLLRRGKPVVSPDIAFLAPCATLIGSVHIGASSSVFYKSILRADNCDQAEAFRNAIDSSSRNTPPEHITLKRTNSNTSEVVNGKKIDDPPICSNIPEEWDLDPDRFIRNNSNATGGGIFIGEGTNIQDGCIIDSTKDHTRIGNGVTVGHLVSIHSATIHDNCLIGMGALLQEGVVVEEESFIAAGANIPKNTVVGSGELWVGNPARKRRDLTSTERERLHYQAAAYVGVASAQKEVMLLGGNLSDSLSQYFDIGHENREEIEDSNMSEERIQIENQDMDEPNMTKS